MKTPELQIAKFLGAYAIKDALEGFRIFCNGDIEGVLITQGWKKLFPNEQPKDREFFLIDNQYWIQDEKIHDVMVKLQRAQKPNDMELFKSGLTIDCRNKKFECKGRMRPKPVCGSCKEGQTGFKTKWVCTHCEMISYSRRTIGEWKSRK